MELIPLKHVPRVDGPADWPALLVDAMKAQNLRPHGDDIVVVAHKLVSKAEGRIVDLAGVIPGEEAVRLAERTGKDPRLVEVILRESVAVIREGHGVLITEHRLGTISANAAVDMSNAGTGNEEGDGRVVLLPEDPDRSASRLREAIKAAFGVDVGVIISDTHGRPFRMGAVGVAIGVSGLRPLLDWRGRPDLYGYTLRSSVEAVADELAAAATLLMGQSDEGIPAVLIRGLRLPRGEGSARELLRPKERDLFR